MDLKTVVYAVNEVKKDVEEVKNDVKTLMVFMAVKKAEDKRVTIYTSSAISIAVGIIIAVASKYLG